MNLWWRSWSRLAGAPREEAEALEMVLAQLRRGDPLPQALERASRTTAALAAHAEDAATVRRLGQHLAEWAKELQVELPEDAGDGAPAAPHTSSAPQPWRTMLAAWREFPSPQAHAVHGAGLLSKLRRERELRLEILLPWAAFVIPTLLLVLGSLGALLAWCTLAPAVSPRDILAEASSPQTSAVTLVVACLLADFALFRWTTGRLVRDLLGGEEVELLYFVGTGVSSGRSLGDTLRLAALTFDGDRQLPLQLAQVALAVKTGEPTPRSIPAGSACWHIAKAATVFQASQPDGEAFRDLSDGMQARRRANCGGQSALVWMAALLPATLLALPAYVAMLGGPTGPFWSHRILQPLYEVIRSLR